MEKVNLLIAVPTMGSVQTYLVSRLIQWAKGVKGADTVNVYFSFKQAPVDRARNQIVKFFLEGKTSGGEVFTHLLMIDSDTIPPIDAVEKLLSHKLPITTGITPILSYKDAGYEVYNNCFIGREEDPVTGQVTTHMAAENTGLQKLFRCGASCLLVAREVLVAMNRPYFQFITNPENTEHVRSEDIYFCDMATELGFEIYADTSVVAQHYKDIMI